MGTTPKLKHHSLTGRITIELLAKAFKRVKRNKGAAGVDRVSIEQYEKNLGMNLAELMRLMKQRHRYHPKPNRRVWIPKTISPRKDAPKRPLGIPGVRDRVAQETVQQLLEPIFEPKFRPHSCGFRPNRGCHTAVQLVLEAKKQGLGIVVDADIKGFFDNLPQDVIIKAVCEEVADGNILEIIRKFLGAGVMEDGKLIDTTRGTPQGGVVSPLLANIVLNHLDWALDGAGFFFVRYADDFVVLCRTPQQAEKALALIKTILQELGLTLSEEKTKITSFEEHFDFLGFTFQEKNTPMTISAFILGQFRENNFSIAPLWLLGLYFFFQQTKKRYRALAWAYIVILIIMIAGNAKVYYLAPIYPLLLAGGAVFVESILSARSWRWLKPVYVSLIGIWTIIVLPFALPVLPVQQFIAYQRFLGATPRAEERSAPGVLPQHYADMFGWEEMVAGVARVYQTLTPEEQAKCVIYVRNYGEAAAIDFFGKKYGLPNALCAHNNYWLWGPGEKTGEVAIILGSDRELQNNLDDLSRVYEQVEPTFITDCDLCMPYENGRQFFLCRGMKTTFQKIWPSERFFI